MNFLAFKHKLQCEIPVTWAKGTASFATMRKDSPRFRTSILCNVMIKAWHKQGVCPQYTFANNLYPSKDNPQAACLATV